MALNYETTMITNSNFRSEIQGLRAIAVLSVFVFHINASILPGGFVGVDIFFVISGFLMTKILYKEFLNCGFVSLKTFYARRIRRLLPVSTLVLVTVGIVTIFVLPTTKWMEVAKEILTSEFYVQNWFLAERAVDYWAESVNSTLLTHYWSLSIEEQYYIFWPILFLLVFKFIKPLRSRPKLVFLLIIIFICICSFAFMLNFKPRRLIFAYFHTGARIWELALGGSLAVLEVNYAKIYNKYKTLLVWLGFVLIIGSFFAVSSKSHFPGMVTLLPVLGTAFFLIGTQGNVTGVLKKFFSTKFMRYIGDISYSLYLWHWPVIVFTGYYLQTPKESWSVWTTILVIVIALALASLSKIIIEDPFRYVLKGRAKAVTAPVILLSSLLLPTLVVLIIYGMYGNVLKNNLEHLSKFAFNDNVKIDLTQKFDHNLPVIPDLEAATRDRSELYALKLDRPERTDALSYIIGETQNPEYKIAIIGNSHAGNWVPAFEKMAEHSDGIQYVVFTRSATQFVDDAYFAHDQGLYDDKALAWNRNVMAKLKDIKPDIIFVTTNIEYFSNFSDEAFESSVQAFLAKWTELTAMGSQVVVLADTPFFKNNPVEVLAFTGIDVEKCSEDEETVFPKRNILKQAYENNYDPNILFWDFSDLFCINGQCPPVINQVLVYRDAHHITKTYMRLLAPYLAKKLRNELGVETNLF